jgi:hypothetical protein
MPEGFLTYRLFVTEPRLPNEKVDKLDAELDSAANRFVLRSFSHDQIAVLTASPAP